MNPMIGLFLCRIHYDSEYISSCLFLLKWRWCSIIVAKLYIYKYAHIHINKD